MTKSIKPVILDGKEYYTIRQFCTMVDKSENAIYRLIAKGNCFRKLRSVRVGATPLVETREVTAFPFTGAGRYPRREVFHYDMEGNVIPCEVCAVTGPGHCPATVGDSSLYLAPANEEVSNG